MINLLPPDSKRELRAARSNTLLLRYNVLLLGALAFLFLATGIVYVYLNDAKAKAERTVAENQVRTASYSAVERQAQAFRSNLTTGKQILASEVNYSKVILQIAALMPSGTILETLQLDVATFGTQTTLSARARSYDAALSLKNSFQGSPLFSNVHFQSISGGGDDASYPISVNLNVTIKKDAAK